MRCADQDIDAGGFHVDPDRAGGDAVEYEQPTLGMHSVGYLAHVVERQNDAGGGFDVRGKHYGRFAFADCCNDLRNRRWCKRRLPLVANAASLEDRGF